MNRYNASIQQTMDVDPTIKDLISHCIEFMSNKETVMTLFDEKRISYPKRASYKELSVAYEFKSHLVSLDDIRLLFRRNWKPCNYELHIQNLESGLLNGHNWHEASPSNLHLSIQNKARECCDRHITLEEYLSIGSDIIKHEYFMVATHDICETALIQNFDNVIPPICHKSITDFVFDNVPYDLKVSSPPKEWKHLAGRLSKKDKKNLAIKLYEGADKTRLQKTANKCKHNWGLNRMYYIVKDQDKWHSDPRGTVQFLLDNVRDPSNYFDIDVHGITIHVCLIEQ